MKHKNAMALTAVLLLSACGLKGGSETIKEVCWGLGETLPSYSVRDTQRTLEDGDRHLETIYAICPELDPR